MRRRLLMLLGLLVVTAIVFAPVIGHEFIAWDDQGQIYLNPDFNPVTWHGIAWNWSHARIELMMPLTYTIWGGIALIAHQPPDINGITLNPAPFHAACVLFHLVC